MARRFKRDILGGYMVRFGTKNVRWVRRVPAEYHEEAVHQDGNGYYAQFKTPEELLADIKLYEENKES